MNIILKSHVNELRVKTDQLAAEKLNGGELKHQLSVTVKETKAMDDQLCAE